MGAKMITSLTVNAVLHHFFCLELISSPFYNTIARCKIVGVVITFDFLIQVSHDVVFLSGEACFTESSYVLSALIEQQPSEPAE